MLAVMTDDAGNILRIARLHTGGRASAPADPGLIAGTAANTPGATRAWFVHNHPSGGAEQSKADRTLTTRMHDVLQGSGVEPRGMIVVAPGGKYTYYHPSGDDGARAPGEEFTIESRDITGGVELAIPASPRAQTLPVTERRLVKISNKQPPVISAADMTKAFRDNQLNQEGVLLLDNRSRPVGFLPMTLPEMRAMRRGPGGTDAPSRRLLAAIDETNAGTIAARVHGNESEIMAAAGNLDGFSHMTGVRLLDVVDQDLKSQTMGNRIPGQSTFYANPFLYALRDVARDVGLHPVRNLTAGAAGGVVGATKSEGEPGSAQWWLDIAAGAAGGITLGQFARRTHLLGKGSIVDNARVRLGDWIESLPLIGRGPEELRDLKAKQRLMKDLLDRQTAEVGKELLTRFTPSQRGMMADLIETRGIVKDFNVIHRQAEILDDYLVRAAKRMKELGMLPPDLEEGGYLHRYYAKHLGLDKLFRESKGQTLSGSYSQARGTVDEFDREYFSPGARDVVDEFEEITRELERMERRRGDLLDADTGGRIDALKARKRALQKQELVEYTGQQNGKIKSFLFARDEVPRVETGISPVLIQRHKPDAGELDTRTMPEAPGVADLKPTDRIWSVRGTKTKDAILHRDWTKAERKSWGEIDDAGYRYVRGMTEASHDLSLATLFKTVANNKEWVSDIPRRTNNKDWIDVPDTRVGRNSPLKKYGALAGQYVRPDVWNGIRGYGRNALRGGPRIPLTEYRVGDVYLGALNKWKLYKTVYNPVTHLNNTYSNVEMLTMGGYSPADIAHGLKQMIQGERSVVWREARDNGLFGGDWTTSLIKPEGGGNATLAELAEKLRTQPEIPDAALVTSLVMDAKNWWINTKQSVAAADGTWASGAEIAKAMAKPTLQGVGFTLKPVKAAGRAMQRAYKFEDDLFKMAVYAAERRKGLAPDKAVKAAQDLFFDYQDLPEGIRFARDLPVGSPFITYTYKAIPALARNIAQNPERALALVAGYEAFNYAALVAEGMSPGEYWQIESAEETTSPPWDRGRALWGARNTVRIPAMEGYRLALGRAHAVGNPFMDEAGGREKLLDVPGMAKFWGSSIFGSNPLHALLDTSVNEDWKGKEIYKPGAPLAEKARKIAAYLYQAWAPSNLLTPGGYQQTKVLEGLANDARLARAEGRGAGVIAPIVDAANRTSEALGFGQFTGLDRAENEILTRDALLASFGIKLRPIRVEQSVDFETSKLEGEKKKVADWYRGKVREHAEDRITDAQFEAYGEEFDEILDRIEQGQETFEQARAFLEKRLPTEKKP